MLDVVSEVASSVAAYYSSLCESVDATDTSSMAQWMLPSHVTVWLGVALGLCAVFAGIILRVMARRITGSTASIMDLVDAQRDCLQRRHNDHQIRMTDRVADIEVAEEELNAATEKLKALKHRCSRRIAFERHLRAVNHNIAQETLELRRLLHAAASSPEESTLRVDAATTTIIESGEIDAALTPQSVRSSCLGQSPATDFEKDARRRVLDPAFGDALVSRVAAVAAEVQCAEIRRDVAMERLHEAERNYDAVCAEIEQEESDFRQSIEEIQARVAEAQRIGNEELARRSHAQQTDGHSSSDSSECPSDIDDLEERCNELEEENAEGVETIMEGYATMDKLTVMAIEQESLIRNLHSVFEQRARTDEFGDGDDATELNEANDDQELGDESPSDYLRERSCARQASLRDEAAWLTNMSNYADRQLRDQVDRLVAMRHQASELSSAAATPSSRHNNGQFESPSSDIRAPVNTPKYHVEDTTPRPEPSLNLVMPSVTRAPHTTPYESKDMTPEATRDVFATVERRDPHTTPVSLLDLTPAAREALSLFSPTAYEHLKVPQNTPICERLPGEDASAPLSAIRASSARFNGGGAATHVKKHFEHGPRPPASSPVGRRPYAAAIPGVVTMLRDPLDDGEE